MRNFLVLCICLISVLSFAQKDYSHNTKSMEVWAGKMRLNGGVRFPIDYVGFNYCLNENWKLRLSLFSTYRKTIRETPNYELTKRLYFETTIGVQRDLLRNKSRRFYTYSAFDFTYGHVSENDFDQNTNKIHDYNIHRYMPMAGLGMGFWFVKRFSINTECLYTYAFYSLHGYYPDGRFPDYRRSLYYAGNTIWRISLTIKYRIR